MDNMNSYKQKKTAIFDFISKKTHYFFKKYFPFKNQRKNRKKIFDPQKKK